MGHGVTDRTYYDANEHGLPFDPLKAIVAPRPIGWISAYSQKGLSSLAPYSFYNLVSDQPKIVMFSSVGWKDAATNAAATGAFAANLVTEDDLERMNKSSADVPSDRSEFAEFGVPEAKCRMVNAPYIADAAVSLECKVTQIIEPIDIAGSATNAVMVLGQVVGYHIVDRLMRDGRFDTVQARPISRLGYRDYSTTTATYELDRPRWGD